MLSQPKFKTYLYAHPNHRLFGEWLVPHTIRGYRVDAWRKLYVFDVMEGERYLNYDEYYDELLKFEIPLVKCFERLEKPTLEDVTKLLDRCTFLMQDGQPGEGIVIKRYDFVNRFGKTVWAKLVHPAAKVATKLQRPITADSVEIQIAEKFLTAELVEKEFAKLAADGWQRKFIPRLLGTVWHVFIVEETFNILRKFHNPKIDFGLLNRLVVERVKALKPELF